MTTETEDSKLGRFSAGFAMAAAFAVLFNTVVACTKDACLPFKKFLASFAGHDWTTQGIADVLLFVALGFIFSAIDVEKIVGSRRLICLLTAATVVAGVGLAAWYIFY
jgi:hypothetical protein